MTTSTDKKSPPVEPSGWLLCLLLAGVTAAVYGRSLLFEFTNFDDPEYVVENPHVRAGLSVAGLAWAFTTTHQANWHPLTWLSLMLDAEISGPKAGAFHFTNLALHVASTLLLFFVLDRMTGARGKSAFVAALFGVHPLHVESVAWIAERKDVLSTFFWFLTLFAWLRHREAPSPRRYGLVILFFSLGLLAKPMLVSLPLVLLLLDVWPLGRLRFGSAKGAPGTVPPATLVREKLPLFALSAASSAVTLYAQHAGGALATFEYYPLSARIANALVAYATYILKTFLPIRLAALYPLPPTTFPAGRVALSAAFLVTVTGAALRATTRRPYLTVGWLWFLITLFPVIGIVQVGLQAMADRYTYVPLVGIFLAVAWGIPELLSRDQRYPGSRVLAAAGTAWIAVLAVLAYRQVGYWRDGIGLFERTIAITGENSVARNNLGSAYYKRDGPGDLERSVEQYSEAVRINPRYWMAFNNLAGALMRLGRKEEAIARWTDAIRIKPDFVAARCNLAGALIGQGKLEEGIAHCADALRSEPNAACAHYNLAMGLLRQGRLDEAGAHFTAALPADPGSLDALLNLGVVRARQGKLDEAIERFTEVLRIDPANEAARHNLERARSRRQGGGT